MVAWLVLVSVQAQALSFEEALRLADASPALTAASAAIEQRRALAEQVPWLTGNPSLILQPGGRRTAQGSAGPELYVGVTQDVSLAGAGASRRAAALAEVDADRLERHALARAVRLNTAQAWLSLWAAQDSLRAVREELALATEWQNKVLKGAEASGFTRVDVAVANAYHAEAHLAALSLEGEVFARGVALNRALARDALAPAIVTPTLPALEIPRHDDAQVLATSSDAAPVKTASAHVEAERARGHELEAARGTSLQVGALGWREGTGDLAAVATLQLTLPAFERAQRERSANAAAIARAEGRATASLAEERAERLDALHEVEHSAEVLHVTEVELVPAAQIALDGLQRRFDAGETTAQELVLARRALVAARARLARARADVAWARFRLSTLITEVSR